MKRFNAKMFEYEHLKYFCCHVALFFLLTATTKASVGAQQLGTPADDFTRYSVVQPIVHHGRSKREITSTRDTAGEHHKQVTVTVNVDGEEYVLDLSLNEQLVSRDHVISYQENGQTVLRRPTKEELDICQYSGTVRGKPGSWVAVSTCRGISGVIHDGHSVKYIEPAGEEGVNGQHFLYDRAALKTTHAMHYDDKNNAPVNNVISPRLLNGHPSEQIPERSSSRLKRGAESFNFEKRYVELVLVADNSLFKNKSESVDNVNSYFMDITNIVNSLFAPLNISITLVRVVVWKERDEIHIDKDTDITRDNFAKYRKTNLLPVIINDYAQLVSHQTFNKYIGSVFDGEICTENKAAGISCTFSPVIGQMASLTANLLGRSLGMMLNKENCDCHDPHCIMQGHITRTGVNQTQWSDCNKRDLADAYAKDKDYCLRNVPGPVCGDGLVQAGEQCDCGPDPQPACAECCHPRYCTRVFSSVCRLRSLPDTSKTTVPDITPLIELLSLYKDQSDIKMKVCIEFEPGYRYLY